MTAKACYYGLVGLNSMRWAFKVQKHDFKGINLDYFGHVAHSKCKGSLRLYNQLSSKLRFLRGSSQGFKAPDSFQRTTALKKNKKIFGKLGI